LAEFTPDGDKDHGLGAVFNGNLPGEAGEAAFVRRVHRLEAGRADRLQVDQGLQNSSIWRFVADGSDQTKIRVQFTYELPGGIGRARARQVMEPIVSMSVRHSDEALRKQIEARYKAR